MRKTWVRLLIIVLLLGGIAVWQKVDMQSDSQQNTSTIDQLLQHTGSGDDNTGTTNAIAITAGSDELQYAGGGNFEEFSEQTLRDALQQQERVILIFERAGDPTSLALRDDISNHEARIPANTTLLFVNADTETSTDHSFGVDGPNTIIYLGTQGEEIRRKGNGIVSLSQIVKGIDGLQ